MGYIIFLTVVLLFFIILPVVFCVLIHVMYRISDKVMRNNIIGDTVGDISGLANWVRYESISKLPDKESCDVFMREYGGDVYGDYNIRANDILYKEDDGIPEDLPEVDIPLFKPKE